MRYPYLTIALDKIEHNARTIVALCAQHGITVTGVTKVTCGNPDVARAMLRGGVSSIGESHIESIERLKAAGVDTSFMLLQLPALSGADAVVAAADVSLNSELSVLEALSDASCRRGRVHDVILMVDLGDLREGIWPSDVAPIVRAARRLPGIRIAGLGTNLACFGAIAPSVENMNQLLGLARAIEHTCAFRFDWISAANSSGLGLIASGLMPARLNHARIGEGILLGRETVHRHPWPGTFQDAFVLHAEVLEVKTKPSRPVGELCEDAFGRLPAFADRGAMMRALLNVGREDVDIDGIVPTDPGLAILGGSSDYLVVDVTDASGDVRVGDELTFSLTYGALLAAMTSEYVQKRPVKQEGAPFDTPPQGGDHCL